MKKLLLLAVLACVGGVIYMNSLSGGGGKAMTKAGVPFGATVAETEKVLGPALNVLPNFGRELRIYKAKNGEKYMLIFQDDELVEIQ